MDTDRRTRKDDVDAAGIVPGAARSGAAGVMLAGTILAAAGCAETEFGVTDPTLTGRITLTHDVSAGPAPSSGAEAAAVSRSVTVDEETDLVVDSVHVVIRELQVAREGAECAFGAPGSGTGGDDGSDCLEVRLGTRVDTLPTDDGTRDIVQNGAIEPATFDRIVFRLNVLEPGETGDQDVLALRPDLQGASVKITGTSGGEPFEILLAPEEEVAVEADDPLTIEDEGSGRMTLHWDVASWFDDPDGEGPIDPVAAEEGAELRSQISANLLGALSVATSSE